MRWCEFLSINITGIYSRDEHMPEIHSPCIINLDDFDSAGTHWTCCVPGENDKTLWYFDSFGMHYPQEFEIRAKRDGITNILFNSSHYQNMKSVLCGYYCLYFLHQALVLNKGYYDIVKPLSITNVNHNEKFIINYFKNM